MTGRFRARSRRVSGRYRLTLGVLAALAVVAAACEPPAPSDPPPTTQPPPTVYESACDHTLRASTPGTVASTAVDELSGLVASQRNPGVWWVHNDSGNPAVVYTLGDDGRDLGTFSLTGATNVDWEDIAVGPGPMAGTSHLYVGDIGDPGGPNPARANVVVYRVPEPVVDGASAGPAARAVTGVEKLTLVYPNGARYDAEALLVDPLTGELYVITKDWSGAGSGRVFRAPANLAPGSTTTLAQVATVSVGFAHAVTGGDVSRSGEFVALRTDSPIGNGLVRIFRRPGSESLADAFGQPACDGATGTESQGEAVGFTPDGRGYVTASEGASPQLHRFDAP